MKTKNLAAALLSMVFLGATLGHVEEAEAAKKKPAASKQQSSKKPARAKPSNRALMSLGGAVPEVSSIIMVMDETQPQGFRIVSADHEHAHRTPASVTKLMTLSLLFDAIDEGRLDLKDKITISGTDTGAGGTMLPVGPGDQITVHQAILGMVTKSANNVAVSVAERLAGSEEAFAQKMNEKARKIGMMDTNFVNSHGMRHPDQYTSAYDLAVLSHHIFTKQSEHYHYFSTLAFQFGRSTYNNHNRLMRIYGGMDGLKTGMTNHGWQLAASAERVIPAKAGKPEQIHRVFGVFLGGVTKEQRNNCLGYLMDKAFLELGHNIEGGRFTYSPAGCTQDGRQEFILK